MVRVCAVQLDAEGGLGCVVLLLPASQPICQVHRATSRAAAQGSPTISQQQATGFEASLLAGQVNHVRDLLRHLFCC
jgi:hypothetical protein